MRFILGICLLCIVSTVIDSKVLRCVDVGECSKCSSFEMEEDYCKETGKKIQISCKGYGTKEIDDYRSCKLTAQDDQLRVLVFQAFMAVIGGLAYWGVKSRKQQNMTRFEHRKQTSFRRNPSKHNVTLL